LPTFGLSLPLFPCAFCVFWNGLFDDLRVFDKWCTSLNPDTAQHVILHTPACCIILILRRNRRCGRFLRSEKSCTWCEFVGYVVAYEWMGDFG
jgi:hypothetical protein